MLHDRSAEEDEDDVVSKRQVRSNAVNIFCFFSTSFSLKAMQQLPSGIILVYPIMDTRPAQLDNNKSSSLDTMFRGGTIRELPQLKRTYVRTYVRNTIPD